MRWIKASERLPEDKMFVHVKVIGGQIGSARIYDGQWYWNNTLRIMNDLNNIEWLDESPLPLNDEDELWEDAIKISLSYETFKEAIPDLKKQFSLTRK